MSRITDKYIEQISKDLDLDEIGIKTKSQRSKDVLNEARALAPYDYIFKREDDSIYYHLIPKYRRQPHEHIPKNATKSEIDLNCQLDKLLHEDLSILTLIYLLRKNMSLTQQLLCKIDNDYHDMIMDLIDDTQPDISMIINIYPKITPQSLISHLNVLAAARNASTVLYTTRNPEPKMCNFIVAVQNLIMSIYPSSRRINRNIIKIKNEIQERQIRILCKQDGVSNDEQRMREIISSYFQSNLTEEPRLDTIIINTDDITNLIAQDNKYTKYETTYLSTRDITAELQGLFSVEYFIIYSFYVEIMPYVNLYFAFRIQSENWQTFSQAFKTELHASTSKITNSIAGTPTHLPRNSHAITCILSDNRASEWVNRLLIAPMQSSNVSPANILINHEIPTDIYNIDQSGSQIDDPKVNDMMTTCIQTVVHALSQQSRLLSENLNDANKVILEQQQIIDDNSEKMGKQISLTEYDNLVRELNQTKQQLNQTKQQLNYEQQQYLKLSKELAPYENLKWKSQELQNQLDMQIEINSEIEEQLENTIEHQTDTTCEYDEDTFTEFLRQKDVFIVGGHEHWRCNMQSILPDAKIVVPEHNNASVDNAKNADYIIINTGMLNHPMFRKVRAAYQSNRNGQVLYINTQASNISRTLRLLYSQVNIKHLQ